MQKPEHKLSKDMWFHRHWKAVRNYYRALLDNKASSAKYAHDMNKILHTSTEAMKHLGLTEEYIAYGDEEAKQEIDKLCTEIKELRKDISHDATAIAKYKRFRRLSDTLYIEALDEVSMSHKEFIERMQKAFPDIMESKWGTDWDN